MRSGENRELKRRKRSAKKVCGSNPVLDANIFQDWFDDESNQKPLELARLSSVADSERALLAEKLAT